MILRKKNKPFLLTLQRIWDQAPHNSKADLIYFNSQWFCVLQEAQERQGGGSIRVIASFDGLDWHSQFHLIEPGSDLQEPKLSITPQGELMLLVHAISYQAEKKEMSYQSKVSFSKDGQNWSPLLPILEPSQWLWKVKWHQGKAYGIAHTHLNALYESEDVLELFVSENGLDYSLVYTLDISGESHEASLDFLEGHQLIGIFRREKQGSSYAWIGMSDYPYRYWTWNVAQYYLESPALLVLPDQQIWAAGCTLNPTPYGKMKKVSLLLVRPDALEPMLNLPGTGDLGSPSLVYQDDLLWVCYHSSHEEKTAVYLAQVQLP